MRFRLDNGKIIEAMTGKQFDAELNRMRAKAKESGIDEIEVGIISGVKDGIRYYGIDASGLDVIEPSLAEFENFWLKFLDSEVID
jgi:hypothetical protein